MFRVPFRPACRSFAWWLMSSMGCRARCALPSISRPATANDMRRVVRWCCLAGLTLAAVAFASQALAAGPGSLDTTIGASGGKDSTPAGVVVFRWAPAANWPRSWRCRTPARLFSSGRSPAVVNGMAIDKNGQIVLVGSTSGNGKRSNIVVARWCRNGGLDTSFGADGGKDSTPDGVMSLDLGESSDETRAVVIQADGKIVDRQQQGPVKQPDRCPTQHQRQPGLQLRQ